MNTREFRDVWAQVGKAMGLEPLAKDLAGFMIQRLLGFWVMWHLSGGDVDSLLKRGWVNRGSMYRLRSEFHKRMGVEVEVFWPEAIAFFESERVRFAALEQASG
jgi:hypothetical protein